MYLEIFTFPLKKHRMALLLEQWSFIWYGQDSYIRLFLYSSVANRSNLFNGTIHCPLGHRLNSELESAHVYLYLRFSKNVNEKWHDSSLTLSFAKNYFYFKMREFTFGIFIIFSLLLSVNCTNPNSTVNEGPDIRVEHLKKYCGVKNWTKKMPDWLMFRTGLDLRWFIG